MNILLIGMNTENITTRLWNDTEAICECELKQWTMDKEVINFVKKQTTAVIRCDTGVVKDVEPKDVLLGVKMQGAYLVLLPMKRTMFWNT